jgi:hypothetical protein
MRNLILVPAESISMTMVQLATTIVLPVEEEVSIRKEPKKWMIPAAIAFLIVMIGVLVFVIMGA